MARRDTAVSSGRPTIPTGSRVVIVVSRGAAPQAAAGYVTVPDLVGVSQGDALARLQDAGLEVRVFNDYSERVKRGRVVGQLPVGGTSLPEGSTQVILVSSGPAEKGPVVPLPDVVGRPEAEAIELLQRSHLSPQVVHDYSPTAPAGVVIGQLPDASAAVVDDADPLRRLPSWLWVLLGLGLLVLAALAFLLFGRQVTVPDVTGGTVEQAAQRLEEAGLRAGSTTATESADAAEGTVVAQSPGPGRTAPRGSEIDLVVVGAEKAVPVPEVVGLEQAGAERAIEAVGLRVRITEAQSEAIDPGEVISQAPSAGEMVPPGTTVGIVVSQGPQVRNVTIPSVVGLTRQDAVSTLEDAGLRVVIAENPSTDVAEGVVMSQLPASGESVAVGTTIGIEVSSGPPADGATVPVPDLTGTELDDAQDEVAGAGLGATPVAVNGTGQPQNEVVAQTPSAGDDVPPGTTIVIFYSTGR